jgi:hypothetical protein
VRQIRPEICISDQIDSDNFLTDQLNGRAVLHAVCHAVCYNVENLPSIDMLRSNPERVCIHRCIENNHARSHFIITIRKFELAIVLSADGQVEAPGLRDVMFK